MDSWIQNMENIPPEQFLDNETTLRLLGDLKNGLLCCSLEGNLFWRLLPFCFSSGQLFLYSRQNDLSRLDKQNVHFVIQNNGISSAGQHQEIGIVCEGKAEELSSEKEKQFSLNLLSERFSSDSFQSQQELSILKISCRHIAGFLFPA